MPEKVLHQIQYLCRLIHAVEWSGVLFYTVKGSIKRPEKMVITLEDILPMDKGSSVFTKYEIDGRFMDYVMADEKRMDYTVGHIHSHNNMSVFFSGTDNEELVDNAPSHDFYLSLIVNNNMDFCARVAMQSKASISKKKIPFQATDEKGKPYTIWSEEYNETKTKTFVYDCEIESNKQLLISDEFADNVTAIIEKDKKESSKVVTGKSWKRPVPPPAKSKKEKLSDFTLDEEELFAQKWFPEPVEETRDMDALATIMFSTSVDMEEGANLEEALDTLVRFEFTPDEIAETIKENFMPIYTMFYPEVTTVQAYSDLLELIEVLQAEETIYPFLTPTINMLDEMSESIMHGSEKLIKTTKNAKRNTIQQV